MRQLPEGITTTAAHRSASLSELPPVGRATLHICDIWTMKHKEKGLEHTELNTSTGMDVCVWWER